VHLIEQKALRDQARKAQQDRSLVLREQAQDPLSYEGLVDSKGHDCRRGQEDDEVLLQFIIEGVVWQQLLSQVGMRQADREPRAQIVDSFGLQRVLSKLGPKGG